MSSASIEKTKSILEKTTRANANSNARSATTPVVDPWEQPIDNFDYTVCAHLNYLFFSLGLFQDMNANYFSLYVHIYCGLPTLFASVRYNCVAFLIIEWGYR